MAVGLVGTGAGLLLISGVGITDEWTGLLGGFIVAGASIGLLNPVIADVAVSVVPKEQSGMASGINDTFRQVGIALGIAVWGAVFLARGLVEGGGADRHRRRPLARAGRGGVVRKPGQRGGVGPGRIP